MAIKREVFLYEILVRFDPDGFRGAHAIDLERVADGKEIIADKELPARPITEAEFGKLLAGKSAALIEAADAAMKQAKEAAARVSELEAQIAALKAPKPAAAT